MVSLWTELLDVPPVLFATTEATPLAKTGGLGDASASLAGTLARRGCDLRLVLPAYRTALQQVGQPLREVAAAQIREHRVRILETRLPNGRTPVWLVDCPELFDRPGNPYQDEAGRDWPDNAERFATLCRTVSWLASAEGSQRTGYRPGVVHLNDWGCGLAAPLVCEQPDRPAVVFAIHNLQHQGLFDRETFRRLDLPASWWHIDGVEFHQQLSFMKAGIAFADRIVTVSPTYAREILEPQFGFGLDGLLRHRSRRLSGILNGIDESEWNPAGDPHIDTRYDAATLARKGRNRRALRQRLGLPQTGQVLIGMVTRLAEQKGIDLLLEAAPSLLRLPVQLAVLGSGERRYEEGLQALAEARPRQMAVRCGYDESLAHLIEAGADLFLMPSLFEPCGLNQMYSMRYGTLPVARRTGGLSDTIVDAADAAHGTGFLFDAPAADALLAAVERAVACFGDPIAWRRLQENAMRRDFSWSRSAAEYEATYRHAVATLGRADADDAQAFHLDGSGS